MTSKHPTSALESDSLPGDGSTPVAELVDLVRQFIAERDWGRYHSPKNLTMAIAIEAAELMEHFQWLTVEEASALADDPDHRAEIEDELADVLIYCFSLAAGLGIDVSTAVRRKMARNEQRFPVDGWRGRL